MKYLSLFTIAALSFAPVTAFVSRNQASFAISRTALNAQVKVTPEIEAAIAEVRDAASAFGEETAGFANRWIDRMLAGNMEGTAAGLLEECVLDDEQGKCEKFSSALEKLDKLLGVGAKEQY
ncbi:hypothetical protein HJC23_006126 [Cyclotella cryptica]|uniref:Uncharacterized protein n=1 Tax=Cyclotella cryptica TaxID=29204 RepID=A0ABD3QJP2_9STRA|eukprot:CCRYP_004601-RA/>CCRYP_004601-RA protein AED:0.06 eAED:0.06 QI:545/1/1/1/1/1/2/419/121